MRVAIIHYWLVGMRGGERVLEQLCRLFPDADIYTHVCIRENLSDELRDRNITETFIARLPGARRHYQKYLGLMPRALEELDLDGYDLILSSEAGPAKGVIVPPDAVHVCYCHSPMRYIWDQYHAYASGLGWLGRQVFGAMAGRLRVWDAVSAGRVDAIIANSSFVARRIRACWRREARVVHPPVDLAAYSPRPAPGPDAPYLFLSQLVPYKRPDLAVEAFRGADRRLQVVGDGPELARLRRSAPSNVTFLGRVEDARMAGLYHGCRALVFPGVEDFGIVPLEAMACGRPVIALGKGGALDTVVDGRTGVLFADQTAAGLAAALDRFESDVEPRLDSVEIAAHAARFSPERFRAEIWAEIKRAAPSLDLPATPPCG